MINIHLAFLRGRCSRFFISMLLGLGLLAALSACTESSGTRPPRTENVQAHTPAFSAIPDPGLLLLLVPDAQAVIGPMVTAWSDAASELGVRVQPISTGQFKGLGTAALSYAGVILPDQLHVLADDGLIKSIRDYTQAGGHTMLVYDSVNIVLAKVSHSIRISF